jgi:hypothetical protein
MESGDIHWDSRGTLLLERIVAHRSFRQVAEWDEELACDGGGEPDRDTYKTPSLCREIAASSFE